jgi:hypothetical protein
VDEGEGVQQLERRPGGDDPGIVPVAAGPDETPVAERGPQPLAAGLDEALQ